MADIARHIFFSGSVQGVGFRFTAMRIAQRWGLGGFVRNCADGRVEMLAQGAADDIERCLEDIAESFAGYIRKTDVQDVECDPEYSNFRIVF